MRCGAELQDGNSVRVLLGVEGTGTRQAKQQLLLPLCLEDVNRADLALSIDRVGNVYRAATVLTLDMAYNNARLVATPTENG